MKLSSSLLAASLLAACHARIGFADREHIFDRRNGNLIPHAEHLAARASTTKSISTTAAPTTTTTTTSSTTPQCTAGTRTINNRQCTIRCNTDRPGGDYAQSRTGTWEGCVQACASDPNCVTAQYHEDNFFCYFKSVRNNPVSIAGEDTIDCEPAPLANGASCKTSDQCLSGYCNPKSVCAYPTAPDGASCGADTDCDSGYCNAQAKCGNKLPDGYDQTCKADRDCLSGHCNTYNKACGKDYSGCFADSDCSSGICTAEYRCGPIPDGGRCYRDRDCVGKYCNLGDGTYGQSYCGLGQNGMGCKTASQCVSKYCDVSRYQCAATPSRL